MDMCGIAYVRANFLTAKVLFEDTFQHEIKTEKKPG